MTMDNLLSNWLKQLLRLGYWGIKSQFGGYGLARFWLARHIEGLMRKAIRGDTAVILGHRMFLGVNDDLGLSVDGIFTPQETAAFQGEVRQGDTVIDIGANIGYFTLLFARLVGPRGQVFAFEPEPINFELLRRNVELNGYCNVTLVPKAVSDASGTARLYLAEHKGDGRIFDSHDGRGSIPIETIRLDDFLKDYEGRIDFIKMDIQGAEPAALRGMTKLLERHRQARIILEFWPIGLKLFGEEPEAFLRSLTDLGFGLWNLDEQCARTLPTTIPELLDRYPMQEENFFNHTNLLCRREQGVRGARGS